MINDEPYLSYRRKRGMLLGLANAYRCGTFFRERSKDRVKHTQRTLCMLRQERPEWIGDHQHRVAAQTPTTGCPGDSL